MRRPALVVAALAAVFVSGCDEAPSVPLPDLAHAEGPVEARILRRRDAVLRDPSVETWAGYARALDAHGMAAEAEESYLAAAGMVGTGAGNERRFEFLHLAGVAAFDLAPERAREHLTRALMLRSDYMATHLHLARLEEKSGRLDAARTIYETVAKRWESSHALLGLGRLELHAGNAETALDYFVKARGIAPKHRQIHEAMARAYTRLGRTGESRRAAKRAGDLSGEYPFPDPLMAGIEAEEVQAGARFRRGEKLARATRLEEAIREFRAGLRVHPDYSLARHYLAVLLVSAGKTTEAREELDRILAKDSAHRKALELRARILLDQNKRKEAERDLRSLLRVDPDNSWARARLGK